MKIIQLTPYWKATKGGYTTNVIALSEKLKEYGHDVIVITTDRTIKDDEALHLTGNIVKRIILIVKQLIIINPDVIHVHGHGSLLFPAFIYKILNHKTKLIPKFGVKFFQLQVYQALEAYN